MQDNGEYNSSSENNNNNGRVSSEYSFSLKRDLCKAGLELDGMEDGGPGALDSEEEEGSLLEEALPAKKTPPPNGKKTKGRVKIKMEFIDNKLRRYTTFSKRKTGIMKKAYELSTLTGTQVMLLVASETGHVYTFATRKLQPMITSEAGKALIQTCLNSPDPLSAQEQLHADQRMSATGFEETELTYTINDEECKLEGLSGGKGLQLVGNSHQGDNAQLSLSHMSLPVSSLLTSGCKGNHNNNSSSGGLQQLSKPHQANFTTLLAPHGLSGSNAHGESTLNAGNNSNNNSGLPLMYQSGAGAVVYGAPTSSAEGVILSLGHSSTGQQVSFAQDNRNSSVQSYITLPVSISPPVSSSLGTSSHGSGNRMKQEPSADDESDEF